MSRFLLGPQSLGFAQRLFPVPLSGACCTGSSRCHNVLMGRRGRRGRGIPPWVILPSVLGFGGLTRMAGQP
jgi:hypothetical protein